MRLIRFFALGLALLLGSRPSPATRLARRPAAVSISGADQGTVRTSAYLALLRRPKPEALLWKIEQGDRPPSHLFGTVHLTDDCISEHSLPWRRWNAPAGARRSRSVLGNFLKTFTRARELMMSSDRRRLIKC